MDNTYNQHWDEKFKSREWGRYPPEDFVRFMGRNYKNSDRQQIKVMEIGCGPGANIWFLHREKFNVSGIDISPTAISLAKERLKIENKDLNSLNADLRVGNFSTLPWSDSSFDVVVDIFALCANTINVIESAITEVHRVLKPGGRFYSKLWGKNTTGYGSGTKIESGTYDDIPFGPCKNMGISHFSDKDEIHNVFSPFFDVSSIDVVKRTDVSLKQELEELHCQFIKAS